MGEWPEFRSDHDPRIAGTATTPAPGRRPLSKRIRVWAVVAAIYGGVLAMAGGGIWYAQRAVRNGRWDDLPLALGLLAPLIFMVWHFVRNKARTGRWGGSREERLQRVERLKARRPQIQAQARARPGSLGHYVLRWAGYAAFEPACPLWQRAAAWSVLAGYGLLLLGCAAVGIISIGASFADDNTAVARALFIGLGLGLLVLPGLAVLRLLRRKRAGGLRFSREEFDGLRAQRAAWRMRESQKPLRQKVMSIVFSVLVEVWWWMRVTVYHSRHPRESWVAPLLSLPAFVWVVWVQLRPPKTADSEEETSAP